MVEHGDSLAARQRTVQAPTDRGRPRSPPPTRPRAGERALVVAPDTRRPRTVPRQLAILAAVSRSVYLTAMGPASGKSAVTLGVVELLSRRVSRLGFFRPIVRSLPDNDLELIRQRYELPSERVGHAFTADEFNQLISGPRRIADVGMTQALAAYKQIESNSDVVVVEGTDFTGVSSPLEFDFNARAARDLGAPVLAVVNGHGLGVADIVEAVRVSRESLQSQGLTVLALIVNRVEPSWLDAVRSTFEVRDADPPVWALPEEASLRYPTFAELAAALDAAPVAGDPDDMTREVVHLKVAAMSVPNVLDHTRNGTVYIAPGDRPDVIVAAALTRHSVSTPSVTGVVLTGGLRPDDRIIRLIVDVGEADKPLPLVLVDSDTFDTAVAASQVEGRITPDNVRKIEAVLGMFETHVDLEELAERIQVARSQVVTPIMFQYDLIERARTAAAHIVLPEGDDDRILQAADRLVRRRVCALTVLGSDAAIRQRASELGLDLDEVTVIDPATSPLLDRFAERFHELRAHRGVTPDRARDLMTDASFFGTMMVHEGLVDGMVSGAAHTTAHTIRPALELIRTRPDTSIVSSVFLMLLADRVLVYGDCAVNRDPDATQLADIAISSAATAELFGIEPRIAMLSYSTGESGSGADVEKVREATDLVRSLRPDLLVDGPIQYDAAIDAGVARTKLPESAVAGRATVFVFPDLNTGNNTYKAVQRSADAVAVGPVLQGLNKPVNDLSRGATVTDIVNTVAITAIQAGADRDDR
jgi:phosphate acetyltransferase